MKPNVWVAIAIILCALLFAVPASALTVTIPAMKDTKPAQLSAADRLILRQDTIPLGWAAYRKVLVNRVTNKVEYVWSGSFNCYIRPRFGMPGAQKLYNKAHFK